MPRSPLTEQYQRMMSLVEQLHALEPDERNFILDLLVPEPEPVSKPQKKSSKKAARSRAVSFCGKCGTPEDRPAHHDRATSDYHKFVPSLKSTRASGMAAQLNKQLDRRRKATPNDNGDDGRCTFRFEDGSICDQKADVNIHHLSTWAHYHPFASPVPDAADSLGQPTIETGMDSAGTAASAGD